MVTSTLSKADVRAALERVMDPEIPSCSVLDLGIVARVDVTQDAIEVDLLPTFSGCPALDVIAHDVRAALTSLAPERAAEVRWVRTEPWTTDRITQQGHERLRALGIAPPPGRALLPMTSPPCPYCGEPLTQEEAAFGPTPCRSIRYCPSCRNPFEAFKPKR